MRLPTTLLLALTMAAAAPAQVREYWVDAGLGNDADPGTADRPVRSIKRGYELASAGDTITIRAGTYSVSATGERFPLSIGGGSTVKPGLRIRGVGAVVIDLEGQVNPAIELTPGASGGRLTNLRFTNMDQTLWWTRAIETFGAVTDYEIDRCVFDGLNRGIILWDTTPDVTLRVHHNLFVNLSNDAINAFEKQGAYEIANNTIIGRSSGPNFVGILADSANARVVNNLIVGMRDAFATGLGTVGSSFVANNVWGNQRDWVGNISTPPPGNFAVDPQFVTGSGYDYRLAPASALIDAGTASAPAMDFAGFSVPTDSNRDGTIAAEVGAFEFANTALTTNYDTNAQLATIGVTGGANNTATLLFSLDDGAFQLTGFPTFLLDPMTFLSFATPPAALPLNLQFNVAPAPSGFRLVIQAVAFDSASSTLQPSNQSWLEW